MNNSSQSEYYLKDTFEVQGMILSTKKFLVMTEGTLYEYGSEKDYRKGSKPDEVFNLYLYKINCYRDQIISLNHKQIQSEIRMYYASSQDQVRYWFKQLVSNQENYFNFVRAIASGERSMIPFNEVEFKSCLEAWGAVQEQA